jgi:hypothetical protein
VLESVPLTTDLCEQLLGSGVVGRVGLLVEDDVLVQPMNYSVVDGAILMRTTLDSQVAMYADGSRLAFEVDQLDYEYRHGWSVLARGVGELVRDAGEIARIEAEWGPTPWASGARPTYLRLRWRELTGRRLGQGWDPLAELPVRRVVRYRER